MDVHNLFTFCVAMFAITNPFGNLAIFISLTSDKNSTEQVRIAMTTAFSVACILVISVWTGSYLLAFFGITLGAFQVAGGIVILLLALSMLHTKKSDMSHTDTENQAAKQKSSVAVVPLALPIIAGPGAITTVIVNTHKFTGLLAKIYLSVGSLIIAALIGSLLAFAGPISRILGENGLNIATRVMGLILAAIACTVLGDGLKAMLPGLA